MRPWNGALTLAVALGITLLLPGSADARVPTGKDVLSVAAPAADVASRLKRFVSVKLGVKGAGVDPALRPMLTHLKTAADSIDRIYWAQRSPEGRRMLDALDGHRGQEAANLARLLKIQYGPWDWYNNDEPFVGHERRPPGVALYPADASRRELDAWTAANVDGAAAIWDPYTVVRRDRSGLVGLAYSEAYRGELAKASVALLQAAAAYTCAGPDCPCAAFASFLRARATSFGNDDYRSSELAWLDTGECPLDMAIGPYEFYEDRLMGLKAAFESIVYYRDDAESERYKRLLAFHDGVVANLPMGDALRARFNMVRPSPITIGDVLYTSGDARAGYQVCAFLLPNDSVVREAKGTKNVVLRNVVHAKFEHLVRPIADRIFDRKTARQVQFAAYLDFLLAWQLAHTVVPGDIIDPSGVKETAQHRLRNRFTLINAVKGEIVALLNYLYLLDQGVLRAIDETSVAATYLASLFDSARLAGSAPQTVAKAIVYNYLAQEWVFRYTPRGQNFEVNPKALREAARKLGAEVLQILGRGDYGGAGRLIVQYGILPGEVRQKLAGLGALPLDVQPEYVSMR